jgi:hypothetical protein
MSTTKSLIKSAEVREVVMLATFIERTCWQGAASRLAECVVLESTVERCIVRMSSQSER